MDRYRRFQQTRRRFHVKHLKALWQTIKAFTKLQWIVVVIFVVVALVASRAAFAHDEEAGNLSGIYYDSVTAGEGIFVTHDQKFNRLAFGFFTHDPNITYEECETIPPVFTDDGIQLRDEDELCLSITPDRTTSWYIAADSWHGSSAGAIYECEAFDYPITILRTLCEERDVGFYILDYIDGTFRLIVTPTGGDSPGTLYNAYYFDTLLLGAR